MGRDRNLYIAGALLNAALFVAILAVSGVMLSLPAVLLGALLIAACAALGNEAASTGRFGWAAFYSALSLLLSGVSFLVVFTVVLAQTLARALT